MFFGLGPYLDPANNNCVYVSKDLPPSAITVYCFLSYRIPLKKYPSMRSIYSEYGTDIQDLNELGQMLKYKYGGPGATEPTPEALKNYMDVSISS